MDWANIASWVFIVSGAFFAITGAFGLLKLPDAYTRLHGASLVDTLGMGLILGGLMFHVDSWIVAVKLVLILVFIFFTSPTTTHALARAMVHGGLKPKTVDDSDVKPDPGVKS